MTAPAPSGVRAVQLSAPDDYEGWRRAARALAIEDVRPEQVLWVVGDAPGDLFAAGAEPADRAAGNAAFSVPRQFLELAETVCCHADPERWSLLYALLLRLIARPRLLDDRADPLVQRIELMAKAVRRDIHKMRAFVRFRQVPHRPAPPPGLPDDAVGGRVGERAEPADKVPATRNVAGRQVEGGAASGGEADDRYVAWFEPEHHIVRLNAGFFVRRFATMNWSILTPELSIHWNGVTLSEAPGATKADAPAGDPLEETWKTYYASIFNPARVKIGAMLKEMPRKYWKNMPETALVPKLIAGAQARESGMIETSAAKLAEERRAERAPAREGVGGNARIAWEALREEALGCTRCPLYKPATQTVFGEGPVDASIMFVGEQPGDQEDLAGRPFVGPAGQLFDRALGQAGIDRATTYVTNAVKHFKFEPRGKRRIHAKPQGPEIDACRWWIDQERVLIRPPVTVALGVTAATSLIGKAVTITATRGRALTLADGGECWVTVHPSFLLRVDDRARADEEFGRFVEDLRRVKARAAELVR